MRARTFLWVCAVVAGPLFLSVSSSASADSPLLEPDPAVTPAVTGSAIASLALANVGEGACSTNTQSAKAFESSCTGNDGEPEYWCADFAIWVWASAGVTDIAKLTAAAGSFYTYGQTHGTLSDTPAVGDAVVFNYQGGGVADHVAIVTQVGANGTIETVSGDWGGQSGTEAEFSSTSSVVHNTPAYDATVGSTPSVMGMTISGFVAPAGGLSASYAATFVSQSFPFATTALTMVAGETVPSYIEMKNTGGKAWDTKTRLGTSSPRDRASVFADSTWISSSRPAGVTGAVAVGDTYKFTFDLHAPATPGTYLEYFNLVEEGVAWFSDPGQGGPTDNDLEVQVVVVAGPDGGAPKETADAGANDPRSNADAAAPPSTSGNVSDPATGGAGDAPSGSADDATSAGSTGGCTVTRAPDRAESRWLPLACAAGALVWMRRRSRRDRSSRA